MKMIDYLEVAEPLAGHGMVLEHRCRGDREEDEHQAQILTIMEHGADGQGTGTGIGEGAKIKNRQT